MKNKIIILLFLLTSIVTANNPYSHFGYDNSEMETKMEELRDNKFILVNEDTSSTISALLFDFNLSKVSIFDKNGNVEEKVIPNNLLLVWSSVDPKASKFPHQSPYISMGGNPILNIDPSGADWFHYQAEGEEKADWHWHKGKTATYTDVNGNEQTSKNGFEYLAVFRKTGKNNEGADIGTLALFKQNEVVAKVTAFSGGVEGMDGIEEGNYKMRIDLRRETDPIKLVDNGNDGLQPSIFWGLENYPDGGKSVSNGKISSNEIVINAYGNSRIRLIPFKELGNNNPDRGLYLHGKHDEHNNTHGCLCDKTEAIQNYFLYGEGKSFFGKVPMKVR